MTIQKYADTLAEMGELFRLSRSQLVDFVKATYGNNALLIKPSLYFRLFRRPWHFICRPFNRVLRWIGETMPLRDDNGNPIKDEYIHYSAMLRMAGFIPLQDYGWHVVDAIPISQIEPEKFKRYFKSQCKATEGMSRPQAVTFLETLYDEYKKKHQN